MTRRARLGSSDRSADRGPADLVAAAASLRWERPDLTAALADHALAAAAAAGECDRWLGAASWVLHARSLIGDARPVAAQVLDGLTHWGAEVLARSSAARLRVELAQVAIAVGEPAPARAVLEAVVETSSDPPLRADAACAVARWAVDAAPDRVGSAIRAADAAWSEVGGVEGEIGSAAVAHVAAAAHRRAGRAPIAVDRAARGLARLEQGRGLARAAASSHPLATALAAEWISALLDAGREDEARRACGTLEPLLSGSTRPHRHLARLRLTVARTFASTGATETSAGALEQAVRDATESDVPDLEAVCLAASGAVHEDAGRLDTAVRAWRLGVDAERRDRERDGRLRRALAAVPAESWAATAGQVETVTSPSLPSPSRTPEPGRVAAGRPPSPDTSSEPARASAGPPARRGQPGPAHWDDSAAPAVDSEPLAGSGPRARTDPPTTGRDGGGAGNATGRVGSSPWEPHERGRDLGSDVPTDDRSDDLGIPWGGAVGDSPIGELLLRSMQAGAGSVVDGAPRNGAERADRPGDPEPTLAEWLSSRRSDPTPGDPTPGDPTTGDRTPGDRTPADRTPADRTPGDPTPGDAMPGDRAPGGPAPCSVVVDVSRGGRRFAGRRSTAIVRAVADRLLDRLPEGARLRRDDGDVLTIELPEWSRTAATDWMRQTLPVLLVGHVADESLAGLHLRAAVHDSDGPVGAQILQRLDHGGAGRSGAGSRPRSGTSSGGAREPLSTEPHRNDHAGSHARATGVPSNGTGPTGAGPTAAGPTAAGPTAAGPTAAGPTAAGPTAAGSTTAAGRHDATGRHEAAGQGDAAGPDDTNDRQDAPGRRAAPGRHDASTRRSDAPTRDGPAASAPVRPADQEAVGPGHDRGDIRAATGSQHRPPAGRSSGSVTPPADGAGIAELLADALAAYRHI